MAFLYWNDSQTKNRFNLAEMRVESPLQTALESLQALKRTLENGGRFYISNFTLHNLPARLR
jgi:hypothetical protein